MSVVLRFSSSLFLRRSVLPHVCSHSPVEVVVSHHFCDPFSHGAFAASHHADEVDARTVQCFHQTVELLLQARGFFRFQHACRDGTCAQAGLRGASEPSDATWTCAMRHRRHRDATSNGPTRAPPRLVSSIPSIEISSIPSRSVEEVSMGRPGERHVVWNQAKERHVKPRRGHRSTRRRASCATNGWDAWASQTRIGGRASVACASSMCRTCPLAFLVVCIGSFLALWMRIDQRIIETFDTIGSVRFDSFQSSARIYINSAIAEPLLLLSSKRILNSSERHTQTDAMHLVEGWGWWDEQIFLPNQRIRLPTGWPHWALPLLNVSIVTCVLPPSDARSMQLTLPRLPSSPCDV